LLCLLYILRLLPPALLSAHALPLHWLYMLLHLHLQLWVVLLDLWRLLGLKLGELVGVDNTCIAMLSAGARPVVVCVVPLALIVSAHLHSLCVLSHLRSLRICAHVWFADARKDLLQLAKVFLGASSPIMYHRLKSNGLTCQLLFGLVVLN